MWLVIVGPVLDVECAVELHHCITQGRPDADPHDASHLRPLAVNGVAYMPPVAHSVLIAAAQRACAMLNSSKSEGMSNTLLEAMACGTPVVARAVPGNLDVSPTSPRHPTDHFPAPSY